VCYSSISAPQIAPIYAQEKGLFAKHGLDVTLVYVDGGTEAVTTLISGEMDICQVGGTPTANAVVAGEELMLIAGLFNRYAYALMVTPNIESAEDLKGEALAVSSFGSSSDSALRTLLTTLGLDANKDVAILAVGNQSSRLAAMESGAIAGTLISVPESSKAREAGYRELANMLQSDIPYPHNAIAARQSFLDEHRDVAIRYLQAIVEAIALMKADRENTIAVLAGFLQLDPQADRSALEEAYDVFVRDGLAQIPYPTVEGVQSQLDAMVAENPRAAGFTADDMIDMTLLADIEASNFLNQITP
jgi:NitT/TauT family transport system substrate-binding protein